MNPRRRARPAIRRDGQVQRIRTDRVRYPGHDVCDLHPDTPAPSDAENTGRLRSVRDTGLALEGRLARERRLRERQTRARMVLAASLVGVLMFSVGAWRWISDGTASKRPMTGSVAVAGASPGSEMRAAEIDPMPVIASYGGLDVRLPVPLDQLTEIGFHQASNDYALSMTTTMPTASTDEVKRTRTTGRDIAAQKTGIDAVLTGSVVRMWRNRPGQPDTAVDVGAPAGADVYAPVTGTVVKIKKFSLYGKYDDYEIHIRPDGFPDIDCVMIHVDDLSCEVGDYVIGGATRVAAVRLLSNRINHQLAEYTKDGGDHVHVQLNDASHPGYKGLEGALSVDGS